MATSSINFPTFSGENGASVSSWLRIVRQKIPVTTVPHQWLDIFDARLEGDAAKWADNTPIICRMLVEDAIDRANEAYVTRFKEAFIAQFDTRTTINEVETANLALENLKQGKDQDLRSYYNRTKGFLEEAEGQDFRETNPPQPFSTIERSFLNHKLIRCLINETVITRTFGYNAQPNQSLCDLYSKAELNLVQLKVEEEQNHARLLQDIGNALLGGKQPHQIE